MTKRQSPPTPTSSASPTPAPEQTDPLRHELDGLVYVLDAPPRRGGRGRNVVTVRLAGQDAGPGLVDRCDLLSFGGRAKLARTVADSFGRDVGVIMGHLAVVLEAAERSAPDAPRPTVVALDDDRRKAAEQLLRHKDLLDRVAAAMESLGHVGEEQTRRLAYLIATSRLLAQPLSALLLAASGSGKSAVLDAVSALLPPEHVVSVARLTPHSLYYMGPHALRHRVVIVDEYEGQEEADHAIRVLQSKGELSHTLTVKGKAESFTVRGPVAVMSGSTSSTLDAQNTSRCVELSLDDSREQTKRVQAAQARAWAGGSAKPLDLTPLVDAQRVLADGAPAVVAIPFAPKLSFPSRVTADRRGSAKLLGLVAAHALLHSRQRDKDGEGRVVATTADYAVVHALLEPTAERAVDGLSDRGARLYRWLVEQGEKSNRRQIAAALAWSYNTAKRALEELLAQELVAVVDPGPPATYRVLDKTLLGAGAALVDPADLRRRP
jgi:hypothetical protein